MKKVLSLVLAICLTAGAVIAVPVTGFADASGQCGDNLTWTLDDDGTLTISGTGDMWDWPYPSGYSPWYNIKESVKKVTIKDGVTSVGDGAFRYCVGLINTTIPKSVAGIGEESFYGCDSLINIDVDRNNLDYSSINGDLYNKGRTELVQYAIGKNDALFDIPDGVISIRNSAFSFCSNLTGVTIPGSVTDIGEHAFMSCSSLINITIPSSVSRIGDGAFASCSSLPDIVIPSGVMDIGGSAFVGCRSLVSITISDSVSRIGDSAFRGCVSLTNIDVDSNNPNYRSVSGNLYSKDGTKLIRYAVGKKDVLFNIPDSVTDIGIDAFCGCDSLTSIMIPVSVISIDGRAFEECANLRDVYYGGSKKDWNSVVIAWGNEPLTSAKFHYNSVSIPDSGQCGDNLTWTLDDKGTLTISGTGDMWDWTYGGAVPWADNRYGIKMVVIQNGVMSIGACAFSDCSSLTSITIPDSVTSIGDSAFSHCSSLTSITIPNGVTSIANYAFSHCSSIMSITILGSVTGIGDSAFVGCSSLTNITIPDSVTDIGDYAFSYCSSLISITIPDSVTDIGSYAFSDCSSLTSITIPDGVTDIGGYAFSYCSSLTSITIPDSVTSIDNCTFYDCSSLTNITIPDSVTDIGSYAFYDCSSLISITIPDSVISIGGWAFSDCSNITNITIPDSVTSIANYAFSGCDSLTSITIPDSVTSISNYAFSGCDSLTSITIPDSVTDIGNYAFSYCGSLISITIPDSVTSIGGWAFFCCRSLGSITMTGSVMRIGYGAFLDCDSIKDVYYVGSEEKWNQINIGDNNDGLTSATIHYNYGSDKIRNIAVDNNMVHLTLKNNSNQAYDSVRLIVGIYEKNGRQMCDMKSVTVKDFSIGYSGDIQLPFDEINPDGKIKIFLWDSSGLLKPITEACKTSVKSVSE